MGYTVDNVDVFTLCRCSYVLYICLQSVVTRGPFYLQCLTLISEYICNHIHYFMTM